MGVRRSGGVEEGYAMRDQAVLASSRGFRWELADGDVAPRQARGLTKAALEACGLEGITDDVVLLVDELVTNAAVHGQGPIQLHLEFQDNAGRLLGEVLDAGREPPRRHAPSADAEHGRGLALVEALADEHGWYPVPGGKAIWFTCPLPASPIGF
jgi:anti-sigma regulatory factor (Ser/Thr protein kinase)